MKISDLDTLLVKLNVNKNQFSINKEEFPNEKYCIYLKESLWEVYYSEKGNKSNLKKFYSEKDACNYFINLIIK